jgi:Fe-S cluster assembly protein SufD
LPHARSEAWKYTPLRTLERRAFSTRPQVASAFDAAVLADIPGPRLVFVNGSYQAAHSDISGLSAGVDLRPLSNALAGGDPGASALLDHRFQRADEVFARLNAALASEGLFLRVEAGVHVEAPLHLVSIGAPADADRAWHMRHLIELCAGASLTLVEHHLASGEHAHLGNAITHVHSPTMRRWCTPACRTSRCAPPCSPAPMPCSPATPATSASMSNWGLRCHGMN